MTVSQIIDERLRAIVGPEYVRAATVEDSVGGVRCNVVVLPGTEKEVAEVLACANQAGLSVIPRGGGTKLGWGNPPRRGDVLLSIERMNTVLEHPWADLTVTIEAGCTLKALQDRLANQGQRLAYDCLWPGKATIGGVLSTNDSGVLRLRYGALRDLIIGVTIVLPDGTVASSGGKVVKNVAGYDLPKLVTGAWGTLGVITRAIFRTHPTCRESRTLSFEAPDLESMQARILAIQNSQLAHTALQVRCSSDNTPEVDVLFEGSPAGLQDQERQLQALLHTPEARESNPQNWRANEQLWNDVSEDSVIGKMIVMPSMLAATLRTLERAAQLHGFAWNAVIQATGIGWVRLGGIGPPLRAGVVALRAHAETHGGSLTIFHRPASAADIDCWGNPGDSISLMRAVKKQFDPRSTLNPGRFLGGI